MDSKNIFCFVCTEFQNPPEIHASRIEYPFNSGLFRVLGYSGRPIYKNYCTGLASVLINL